MAGSHNNDFARQVAERNAELTPSQAKKFRSSTAPKGSKLASGYQDRTQLRTSIEEDEKATRVKALEEMVKLGQMDQATFEKLRDEIVGGDVKDVHLVKGLDYKLLERVRRGEDVLAERKQPEERSLKEQKAEPEIDVDEEFEKLEDQEIAPLAKEEKSKKGEMAPPSLAGKKRTRDDILKELKASRLAAAAEAKARQPTLGAKFKKVGDKREQSRMERDEKGREVLIMVDADGNVKRKVKKPKIEENLTNGHGLMMPDKNATPLGMNIVPADPPPAPQQDEDIFEGVGTDYNLLGEAEADCEEDDTEKSDDKEEEEEELKTPQKDNEIRRSPNPIEKRSPKPPSTVPSTGGRRNYFNDRSNNVDEDDDPMNITTQNSLKDPTILAALKKASSIAPISSATAEVGNEAAAAAKLLRRKKMLETHDRDNEDMEMGFGGSRLGDEEDGEEGRKVRLSVWGDEEEADGKRGGKEKRKRGPKKKKKGGLDVDSAADVMELLGRRKG